jgi:hypothetical protein
VIERDRGYEEFHRVEIFLPESWKKISRVAVPSSSEAAMEALSDAIAAPADPHKLTSDDRAMIWRAAVETIFALELIAKV